MQTENSKILGLFNPKTRNTNRFEALSSGANGVIYKNKSSGGLIKVSKKFNLSGNNNKLNNEKKAEKIKYYAHATKVLGNAVRQEFEITKRVYDELLKNKQFVPFVPMVSNLRTANNGGMALFKMSRVPGITLTRFANDPNTTVEDLENVKQQCLAYVKKLEQLGILHGDLNTNNIMVRKDGKKIQVHFIDFGRSQMIGQLPPGSITYTPWPSRLGCTGNTRLCALPYTVPNNSTIQPYARNDKVLAELFPPNKKTAVSYSRQLKDLHKILNAQINATQLTANFKNRLLRRVNIPEAIKNKIKTKNVTTSRVNYKPIETVLEFMNHLEKIKNTLPFKTPNASSKKTGGCGMFGCFGGGPSQKYV